jgi:hypothetical protein
MDCGEQALLPAVRGAGPDTLVVAGGFSCKTQIADSGTGRHALHLAEVMKAAREGAPAAGGPVPCPGRGLPGAERPGAPVRVEGPRPASAPGRWDEEDITLAVLAELALRYLARDRGRPW